MMRLPTFCSLTLSLILTFFLSVAAFASTTPEQQAKSIKLSSVKAFSALDHHIVKIGVFYTNDLLDEFSIEEINRYVEAQFNAANIVMENSGVAIRRELGYLGVHPIENDPNQRIEDFLSRIRGNEGDLNRVIAGQYGLDYVTVLRPMNDNRFCGWAYYGDPYAILQMGGRCISNTLAAHEWGHNDGADHDKANSSAQPVKVYGHGYFCGGEGTIMSSPSGDKWNTRHNFYSTPDISIRGDACGEKDTANVVRMLNELKDNPFHMGNRQSDPEQLAFVRFTEQQPLLVKESDGVITVTVELVNAEGVPTTLGQKATIELITGEITALSNTKTVTKDYQPLAQHIVFQPGENRVDVEVIIVSDDVSESDETFKLILRNGDIISPLTSELEVTITENSIVTPTKVQFSQTDLVILSVGQSRDITLLRTGDLTAEFTAYLSVSNNLVTLSPEQVVFNSGQSEATFSLSAIENSAGKTALIQLANDQSQLGENISIEVYILADEIISFTDSSELSIKAGDTVTLTLNRTGELLSEFDVEVELSHSWMTASTSTVHFNAQQATQSFTVTIIADTYDKTGVISLALAPENIGSIIERTVKVPAKIVVPVPDNSDDKPTSSGGSGSWLILMCLIMLTKRR